MIDFAFSNAASAGNMNIAKLLIFRGHDADYAVQWFAWNRKLLAEVIEIYGGVPERFWLCA